LCVQIGKRGVAGEKKAKESGGRRMKDDKLLGRPLLGRTQELQKQMVTDKTDNASYNHHEVWVAVEKGPGRKCCCGYSRQKDKGGGIDNGTTKALLSVV